MIQPLIVTALNASTYTAITLGNTQNCRSIGFWTEDGSPYYLSDTSAGTINGLTLDSQQISLDTSLVKGETLFYAKALTGTPNMVVIITR